MAFSDEILQTVYFHPHIYKTCFQRPEIKKNMLKKYNWIPV